MPLSAAMLTCLNASQTPATPAQNGHPYSINRWLAEGKDRPHIQDLELGINENVEKDASKDPNPRGTTGSSPTATKQQEMEVGFIGSWAKASE